MFRDVLPLSYLKKAPFHGSYKGMRYCVQKEEDSLVLCVFPGPYAMDHTPDEDKQYFRFPFTDEGYEQMIGQVNRSYEEGEWDESLMQDEKV